MPAIEAGATGYLFKDTPIGTLTDAMSSCPREVQVLGLVAQGLSNSDIGRQLYIGEATVKTHMMRTFVKLGVNDRTAAVTVALSRGILTSPHQ
ncbi:response regulator transcription factor [Streptomyces sp. NPDC050211]|uniref:response regulator transcription factor n=1 Tax=Streptomyces sp. NPDC050211 TaxID=3154932 RepID=UPI003426F97A